MRAHVSVFAIVVTMLFVTACGAADTPVPAIVPSVTPTFVPVAPVPTFTALPPGVTVVASLTLPAPTATGAAAPAATAAATSVSAAPLPTQTARATGTPGGASVVPYFGVLGAADGQLASPRGLAVATDGVYVVERDNARVQKFTPQGAFVWKAGSNGGSNGQLSGPLGIAVNGGRVYVADTNNRRIAVFDAANGKFLKNIGQGGNDLNQLLAPVAVAFDSEGKMFVADSGNRRIQVYAKDETPARMIAGASGREDAFGTLGPGGVIVDGQNTVWASDPSNHRLMQFDFNGKYVRQIGSPPDMPVQMQSPMGLALDSAGQVYAADPPARQIFIFGADGELAGAHSSDLLLEPSYVAVDSSGRLYVVDTASLRVVLIK
jgi:sugar lactone lactonase YvrE